MKQLVLLMLAGLLVTGCAGTQDLGDQDSAAVEQRDLLETQRKAEEEETRRRAQAAREQEELNRKLDEQRRKDQEAAAKAQQEAEIRALKDRDLPGASLGDAKSQLKDPASMVSKRSIYYEFDRYDILTEFAPMVEAHANLLRENADLRVRIEGNCDERGSTEYNLALGQRRADSVKKALTVLGVPAGRVEAVSYGEEKPKAKGQDEDSYAENRRSDILYPGND
jgi:peptidoglycan-associated lipoprotein